MAQTKVYLVIYCPDGYGGYVRGAFATKQLAEQYITNIVTVTEGAEGYIKDVYFIDHWDLLEKL